MVDLDSGAVLAVAAEPAAAAPPAGDAAAQAERLARLARRAAVRETLLPLVLPVPAPLLTVGPEPFTLVEHGLRRAGRRPRDVTLMVGPELRDLPPEPLLRGIAHLREAGFRCALGTASVAPDVLLRIAPFVFRVDPAYVAGIPGDERLTAVVEGLARIGRGSGIFPLAAGVATVTQLMALRRAGVRLAEGPFFADDAWTPGERVAPLPDAALVSTAPGLDVGPRVSEFVVPAVTMGEATTAEEVLEAFGADEALTSVILVDGRERPVASLDRARFLLAVTGPYGHALHAKRPAARLADPPRTVARDVPAMAALRAAGAGQERVYDDLIAVNEFGQCAGVVRVGDLIRSLARE
ncbi:diguanylate phosphodiesterase [Marinitenerispora sediminis]|uniref:Diguanylate phosphodiesterase n=1 Tax=Marinitenerispora sediminis TaxID=1931232 RepID=A0A368SY11_9ACTN|nr:diguanylate phosphodiesterase [Marinitenerispora sediminis]RCV48527.1 diguanylate phosphodiesterase [Marinitenerispora sediminis]RCV54618.1 diguanylate phosphodiesterase [Marinitenerispora sediminis]